MKATIAHTNDHNNCNDDNDTASKPSPSGIKRKRKKKKKKPKTHSKPLVAQKLRSRKKARKLTTQFHRITKQLEQLDKQQEGKGAVHEHVNVAKPNVNAQSSPINAAKAAQRREELEQQLKEMGGRRAYQDASILSTAMNRSTSKYVFSMLTKYGMRPRKGQDPLRVFEVGAINLQISSCPWLSVRAIDINSRSHLIEQADFFDIEPAQDFQVTVCSMVINCVPSPEARGDMLVRMWHHLKHLGIFFLMLPLQCLTRSAFLTEEMFSQALKLSGFEILQTKNSPRVAFFCLRKADKISSKKERMEAFPHPPKLNRKLSRAKLKRMKNQFAISFLQ